MLAKEGQPVFRLAHSLFVKGRLLGPILLSFVLASALLSALTFLNVEVQWLVRIAALYAIIVSMSLAGLYTSMFLAMKGQEKTTRNLRELKDNLSRVDFQSAVLIPTQNEVFARLCRAREETTGTIHLMKIRLTPPVKIVDGKVQLSSDGSPVYDSLDAAVQQWYDGMGEWLSSDARNRLERLICTTTKPMKTYADFLDEQLGDLNFTLIRCNVPLGEMPPVVNVSIFEGREALLTISNTGQSATYRRMKGVWIRSQVAVDYLRVYYYVEFRRRYEAGRS